MSAHKLTGKTEPAEVMPETSAEQHNVFEPTFEMPEVDLADLDAVFGPAAGRAASAAASARGVAEQEVPAAPQRHEFVEEAFPITSKAKDSSLAPARANNAAEKGECATSEATATYSKNPPDPAPIASATTRAREPAIGTKNMPEEQTSLSTGLAKASTPAPTIARGQDANQTTEPVQFTSEILTRSPSLPRDRAQHDDSGVHFVANDSVTAKLQKKEGYTTGMARRRAAAVQRKWIDMLHIPYPARQRLQADPMNLDADLRGVLAYEVSTDASLPKTRHSAVRRSSVHHILAAATPAGHVENAHREGAGKGSCTAPHQPDVQHLQSTPVGPAAAKRPEPFLPWSAIPTRTAELRQGPSRAVKLPIPAVVRQQAQPERTPAATPRIATVSLPLANSAQKAAPTGRGAPAGSRPSAPAPHAYRSGTGSRSAIQSDRIVLEERPADCYEEFFEVLVDLGRVRRSRGRVPENAC